MDHHSHHSTPSRLPPQLYMTIPTFLLESGETLINAVVSFTFHGLLNSRGDNAIVVCHALSGSSALEDWWPALMAGPNPVLDPSRYCIICLNSLGSPYGSSSPLTYRNSDKISAKCYGPTFPKTTIRDDVRIHKHILDILGVKSLHSVIGASMGGMLALEWSFFGEDYVRALVLIATTPRQGAWQIAWSENQRRAVLCDEKFRDGWYGDDPPLAGLAAARMIALMTYRSYQSFERRFGRRLDNTYYISNKSTPTTSTEPGQVIKCESETDTQSNDELPPVPFFTVQSYLRYHGDKFNTRFDANCYLHILDKMDSHDITRGRCMSGTDDSGLEKVLGRIKQPTLVVGIPSDGLYPIQDQEIMYKYMPNAVFAVIDSCEGHDAFLIETAQVEQMLRVFFDKLVTQDKYAIGSREESDTESVRQLSFTQSTGQDSSERRSTVSV